MNMYHANGYVAVPNGIWFQRGVKQRAYIQLVNDQYRYRIIDLATDTMVSEGSRKTLPLSKKAVLEVLI